MTYNMSSAILNLTQLSAVERGWWTMEHIFFTTTTPETCS